MIKSLTAQALYVLDQFLKQDVLKLKQLKQQLGQSLKARGNNMSHSILKNMSHQFGVNLSGAQVFLDRVNNNSCKIYSKDCKETQRVRIPLVNVIRITQGRDSTIRLILHQDNQLMRMIWFFPNHLGILIQIKTLKKFRRKSIKLLREIVTYTQTGGTQVKQD